MKYIITIESDNEWDDVYFGELEITKAFTKALLDKKYLTVIEGVSAVNLECSCFKVIEGDLDDAFDHLIATRACEAIKEDFNAEAWGYAYKKTYGDIASISKWGVQFTAKQTYDSTAYRTDIISWEKILKLAELEA